MPLHRFCPCHQHKSTPMEPVDWHSGAISLSAAFIEAYSGQVYEAARTAGLTDAQSRRAVTGSGGVCEAGFQDLDKPFAKRLLREIIGGKSPGNGNSRTNLLIQLTRLLRRHSREEGCHKTQINTGMVGGKDK
jgi:hypothetical protein